MKQERRSVKRYEIYLYDFGANEGSIQSGLRPVLVIQDDRFNEASSTTIIAPFTSVIKREYLVSHVVMDESSGLTRPSMVMMEQVRTVNQKDLGECVGTVKDTALRRELDRCIKKTFGLWNYMPKNPEGIRCLCPSCVRNYIDSGMYFVRRLDPFQRQKGSCEKCDRQGWDYVITEKTRREANEIGRE